MEKIADYIEELIATRLRKCSVVVIYDGRERYRELCLSMTTERRSVVDASESSIRSREAALAGLQAIGQRKMDELLIYVPAAQSVTDEEKQHDPFATYAVSGAVFPDAANDGDAFEQICLAAKPSYAAEIRAIFAENDNPSFAMIDNVGGGNAYPQLQTLLDVSSPRGLLCALLAPTQSQRERLEGSEAWLKEGHALVSQALGTRLKTRSKKWERISAELWELTLFSEFVFDLPVALPESLQSVARADAAAQPFVERVCERLRDSQQARQQYIDQARRVEQMLALPERCAAIDDLGVRDTFPFEERTFFLRAVEHIEADDLDEARAILGRRTKSVWSEQGEHQREWELIDKSVTLIEQCGDLIRELDRNSKTQADLVAFYTQALYKTDRLQREVATISADMINDALKPIVQHAYRHYNQVINAAHTVFVRHLDRDGWPPTNYPSTMQLFDQLIAPKLKVNGQRVAVLWVDALRYELGVELEKRLVKVGGCELGAAYAPLPTVTPLGMAALLPAAASELRVVRQGSKPAVQYGDKVLSNVNQRISILGQRYGQRLQDAKLRDVAKGNVAINETTDLLIIRSNQNDASFETDMESGLAEIGKTFRNIVMAVKLLAKVGFHDVIVLTDHGFLLAPDLEAGDVGVKPAGGSWVNVHDRLLLGAGSADVNNWVISAEKLGIRGDFAQAAGPKGLVAYRAGVHYMHGGASLQEAVVPYLMVKLKSAEADKSQTPVVTLNYKRKRITSKRPVIEVSVATTGKPNQMSLFAPEPVELLIEAHDKDGNIVGQAQGGDGFDSMTGVVRVTTTTKVTFSMNRTFEGKFTVKAFDPTTLVNYATLDLKTDYMVL